MLSMEEIYRAHSLTVYRYLLSQTHDAGLSEELTQETFYQAIKSVDRFDGSCKISTWLCAIAKNVLLGERRRHPPTEELDESAATIVSTEEKALAKAGETELLRKLHLMNGEMREVMYLRLLGGASFREIGDILGKTENWARVTCHRARIRLQERMDQS